MFFKKKKIDDYEDKANELLLYIIDKDFNKTLLEVVLAMTMTTVCGGDVEKAKKMLDKF